VTSDWHLEKAMSTALSSTKAQHFMVHRHHCITCSCFVFATPFAKCSLARQAVCFCILRVQYVCLKSTTANEQQRSLPFDFLPTHSALLGFSGRRSSKLVSVIVSAFTASFVQSWSLFFPDQTVKSLPIFDRRTICYPTDAILRDYLSWRQADTHINNQVCVV